MAYPNENYETPYEELQSLTACLEEREVEALITVVRKMLDVEAEGDFDYLTPKDLRIIKEAHEHEDDPEYWISQDGEEPVFDVASDIQEKIA